MPAAMPVNWIRTTVRDMQIHQQGYVPASSVLVGKKGETYLLADRLIDAEKGLLIDPVLVELEDDGYHIYLHDCRARWDAQDLTVRHLISSLVPVTNIHD